MRRREFLGVLSGGAVAWACSARAQQPAKTARIGFLGLAPASAWQEQIEAFRAGLRDFGYVEGRNITIDFEWAADVAQTAELAARLVRSNVDIILAPASTQVEPARQATRTIPIVFAQHADPIGIGHVASFARPGGNITGVSMVLTEMSVKGLEILVETVPNAKRIGVLWNPTTPTHPHILTALQSAALTAGVELVLAPAQTVEDFEGAYAAMSRDRVSGVLVPSSPLTNSQRTALAELGVKHALPAMFANKANVQAGGLMSYGSDFNYMYRRVAFYIDKILKGERPAELPVEQASKYQLVINLKTARALGIAVPPALLARADEVIE